MGAHNELGKKGEVLAVDFLIKKGYDILKKNYRYQQCEVDIIAKKGAILAAVEVKTRASKDFGDPQQFLKHNQIQRIIKAVDYFVNDYNMELEVRFDIIAIVLNKTERRLDHLENAFYHF